MRALLLRLTAGGLICGLALALGGRDGKRELLRFACACVMAILLITGVRGLSWELPENAWENAQLEDLAAQAQAERLDRELEAVAQALSRDAEEQAALLGLDCTARVTCGRAEDGQASITGAHLTLRGGDETARARLGEALALRYGLPPETIEMEEASP